MVEVDEQLQRVKDPLAELVKDKTKGREQKWRALSYLYGYIEGLLEDL